jgi:hypothetical protein
MKKQKIDKVVCEVYRSNTKRLIEVLKELKIEVVQIQSARSIVLREKQNKLLLTSTTKLEEDPIDIFYFYIYPQNSNYILAKITDEMKLNIPGNGTIYSETIEMINDSPIQYVNDTIRKTKKLENINIFSNLIAIRCIVQRGKGNEIVRSALDLGTTVPSVTFGEGTGLRDKIGLLRITIPAEKEIVTLVIGKNDANDIMNVLIDIGRLDLPGKGFIYLYPVARGIVNSKIFRGKQKYVASMEQIILAIDSIKGNMEWRKRSSNIELPGYAKKRKFLTNLVDLTLICNEGRAMEIVEEAMAVGAAGATISKLRFDKLTEQDNIPVSRAREMANMIIGADQVELIAQTMIKTGLFDQSTCGFIEIKPVPKACTYLGN